MILAIGDNWTQVPESLARRWIGRGDARASSSPDTDLVLLRGLQWPWAAQEIDEYLYTVKRLANLR